MKDAQRTFEEADALSKLLDSIPDEMTYARARELFDKLHEDTEENLRRWQEWRDRGLVRPEVAFCVLAYILEMMDQEAGNELYDKEPRKGLWKKWDAIKKREGLEEDEEFLEGDEPKDLLTVLKKLDQLDDALYTGLMRKHGEAEMAELWLHNRAEYDRRRKAGEKMLYAEPELAEAQRILNEASAKAMKEYEKNREKELEAERLEKENAHDEGRKDD